MNASKSPVTRLQSFVTSATLFVFVEDVIEFVGGLFFSATTAGVGVGCGLSAGFGAGSGFTGGSAGFGSGFFAGAGTGAGAGSDGADRRRSAHRSVEVKTVTSNAYKGTQRRFFIRIG